MRPDFKIIADIISAKARVIDIGCGNGDLLKYLAKKKQVEGRGIELDQRNASRAVSRGISVIQGDADADLKYYPDKSFDYAILSQTIQATKNPKEILLEMLRIANHAIVSFPNFGHIRNRLYLCLKGRMPVTKNLSYEWYETPNIHFCTIKDFVALAGELGLTIEKKYYVTRYGGESLFSGLIGGLSLANLFGDQGIFLLKKEG